MKQLLFANFEFVAVVVGITLFFLLALLAVQIFNRRTDYVRLKNENLMVRSKLYETEQLLSQLPEEVIPEIPEEVIVERLETSIPHSYSGTRKKMVPLRLSNNAREAIVTSMANSVQSLLNQKSSELARG